MGNSDHSNPRSREPAISLTAAAPLWHAFVRDYSKSWPVTDFKRPKRASSRRPSTPGPAASPARGPGPRRPPGSSPGRSRAPGRRSIPTDCCTPAPAAAGEWTWSRPSSGHRAGTPTSPTGCAVLAAAPAATGQYDSRTAYFWKESSWGGAIAGACYRPKPDRDRRQGRQARQARQAREAAEAARADLAAGG